MTVFVITVVASFVGIAILLVIIAILVRVHRKIQKQSLSTIQTTAPPSATLSGVLYEEPDCQVNQNSTQMTL